ncbi:MAG: carboxylating nicotinate-nucleotide diphosphorylase [Pseudomonadota bacterium]
MTHTHIAMRAAAPIPYAQQRALVEMALREDLGLLGDVTSHACVPPTARAKAALVARTDGVIAGLELARLAFECASERDDIVAFESAISDGAQVAAGTTLAAVEAPARTVLAGERVALNLLSHASGIATATRAFVAAIEGTGARITCTRKTLPGLRAVQKYAVRVGGGHNHRIGLFDAVMIKDNHIAAAGGVREALATVRQTVGHLVKIEIEVDTLEQLRTALEYQPDVVLLDNMAPATLREAVEIADAADRRPVLEASGGVTLATVRPIAQTGVDVISVGGLTHSVMALDIGLDIAPD